MDFKTTKKYLPTAGLVSIKEDKLLLAYSNNRKAWYLPGGKIDAGEEALQSLRREILEELNINLDPDKISYYCHVTAPAYGLVPEVIMEQDCFLYPLTEQIEPSNEIGAVRYFSHQEYQKEPIQVIGVLHVFDKLKADGLI
ncbi:MULTISPECIES: NUDIX hydrolase [Sphingobacterium]|jgi:8-oxo-dGTP pyrophosphatase MutT (NUDIX family)|nr:MULTISPECIES: NUDIX domain-containing protein [Sphingobacterium]HAF34197.1 NUDIX domain-containing protein [Sphingobacterium sp.]OFV15856.1 DNA mismatch repair protein MutT [Sphingobacterium sp. HMSC13C05]QQT62896.1 NUDIX domain-containing protein [Sphingobacterium multivorum]HAK27784.1 NUDIX domain-containing protein [Sphingobacterium sp.]HAL53640.1 NUDIX domain-containing protein [Sphingobacterium sp.]